MPFAFGTIIKNFIKEANFLKQINHPLVPKVLWMGKIDKSIAMVENRLRKNHKYGLENSPKNSQTNIIKQIIQF